MQYRRKVWQPKGALHVSASSAKKILIMGGTRFIGVFLSRLLVKEGHQVTLFTRGKAPITQQLPGESEKDYVDFSSKILHLKVDRKDIEFVKASLLAEGFDVVYDINVCLSDAPILDCIKGGCEVTIAVKWVEIIGQARHSVDFLKDEDVIRTVLNILQELIDVEGDGMADMDFHPFSMTIDGNKLLWSWNN
ncbi:hypothetical protein TEA_002065 [Camellia sinensis var. sinensis]|uniref:NAD-dependent epimerase/dehydratase domain-containing protein n=1 Tax=Camellia sinensis var. sinensis TaxID=542762 RepID=A0A4S4DDH5_CAMSN|nr:hypothetical protein TEA_002065 [Camellia sinensis var. sinensis]